MQRKPDSVEWILVGIIVVAVLFVWYSSNSSNESVAIIRLQEIAKETGRDFRVGEVLREERTALESDFMRQQKLLQEDIESKREEFGKSPTPEQAKNLQLMQKQMQSRLLQTRQRSQAKLKNLQMEQMQEFMVELQPIIIKLCTEGDYSVVLDQSMGRVVFYADPLVDITDAVIEELNKQ